MVPSVTRRELRPRCSTRSTSRGAATSLVIAGLTTLLALLIGYPTACRSPGCRASGDGRAGRRRAAVLDQLPGPHLRLDRAAQQRRAWSTACSRALGLIDEPLELLYTQGAVVAGLLYAYLPLMILPLYVAIERLDPELREASANLGARPVHARSCTVTLPHDPAGRADRLPLRVRAQPRQLRHPRAPGRRQDGHGRQPDPGPVPEGPRLALRLRCSRWPCVARRWSCCCIAQALGGAADWAASRVRDCCTSRFWADVRLPVPADRRARRDVLQRRRVGVHLEGFSPTWFGELAGDERIMDGPGQHAPRGRRLDRRCPPCSARCSPSAWPGTRGRGCSTPFA